VPMGLAVAPDRLAVATRDSIVLLVNEPRLASSYPRQPQVYDALFVPRSVHHCGALAVHDMVFTVGIYALTGFEVSPATMIGFLTVLSYSLYDTVVVFDKVRENTKDLKRTRMTYAEAANLAVNQTLVRSINTSIVALIPVAAILYVGVVQLGSGSLKDLALALFVGMAAGTYSSVFVATPLLAQLKIREAKVAQADKRTRARQRHDADRYAAIPAFVEDQPPVGLRPGGLAEVYEEVAYDGEDEFDELDELDEPAAPPRKPANRAAKQEPVGKGRVVPESDAPLLPSKSAGRVQPAKQTRSKRGKK